MYRRDLIAYILKTKLPLVVKKRLRSCSTTTLSHYLSAVLSAHFMRPKIHVYVISLQLFYFKALSLTVIIAEMWRRIIRRAVRETLARRVKINKPALANEINYSHSKMCQRSKHTTTEFSQKIRIKVEAIWCFSNYINSNKRIHLPTQNKL